MKRIVLLLTRGTSRGWWVLDSVDAAGKETRYMYTLPVLLEIISRKLKGKKNEIDS